MLFTRKLYVIFLRNFQYDDETCILAQTTISTPPNTVGVVGKLGNTGRNITAMPVESKALFALAAGIVGNAK